VGKPLDFSRYEGMAGDRFVERAVTDEIMYELMLMSGQEYVDQYASSVKKEQGSDVGFGSRERGTAPGAPTKDVRDLGDRVLNSRVS
jgi:1-acyl-sn-glycerol-3-phosphate acyltransferase